MFAVLLLLLLRPLLLLLAQLRLMLLLLLLVVVVVMVLLLVLLMLVVLRLRLLMMVALLLLLLLLLLLRRLLVVLLVPSLRRQLVLVELMRALRMVTARTARGRVLAPLPRLGRLRDSRARRPRAARWSGRLRRCRYDGRRELCVGPAACALEPRHFRDQRCGRRQCGRARAGALSAHRERLEPADELVVAARAGERVARDGRNVGTGKLSGNVARKRRGQLSRVERARAHGLSTGFR
jgi:hypothetical protein